MGVEQDKIRLQIAWFVDCLGDKEAEVELPKFCERLEAWARADERAKCRPDAIYRQEANRLFLEMVGE